MTELHIAVMSAGMQSIMMTQALKVARGNFQPQERVNDVKYEPASAPETTMRAHRLVGEIIEHCDEISRRTAERQLSDNREPGGHLIECSLRQHEMSDLDMRRRATQWIVRGGETLEGGELRSA